jgi:hypothetical protein
MGNETDNRNYRDISLLLSRLTTYVEDNGGNLHVGFNAAGQLLTIKYSAFVRYVIKIGIY